MKKRVEFYDVDAMGVMWHGHYAKFLEAARCELLERAGYGYAAMREDDLVFPVVKMDFKFIAPALYGDVLDIRAQLLDNETMLCVSYEITNAAGAVICKASTAQACVQISTRTTLFELPAPLLRIIKENR